jgi:pimeloyl-ACP methyl ester carboxylesterase
LRDPGGRITGSLAASSQSSYTERRRAARPWKALKPAHPRRSLCPHTGHRLQHSPQVSRWDEWSVPVWDRQWDRQVDSSPAPDPVFWLEGGPGGGASREAAAASQQWLPELHKDHDLVFVDQRGTGESNGLACGDIGDDPANLDGYFGKLFPPKLIGACREKLKRTANLKLYTTSIAADDLEDIRGALGYRQINLVGVSYGTLAAQVYMRKYPYRIRSAFLLGLVNPGFRLPLPFARAAQNALDLLFRDCSADSICHQAFPEIAAEFYEVLAQFNHGPLKVKVIDSKNRQERVVLLERENYVEHLRAMLYSTTTARFLPLVVHQAFLGNFVPFGVQATETNIGGPSLDRGLYFSVTCAEDIPFITESEISNDTRGTFLGDQRTRAHIAACKEWPRAEVSREFIEPLKTNIPILVFSGEADGAAPPWIAQSAVKFWPNGRQVEIPRSGHQLEGACEVGIIQKFIRDASARELNTSCVDRTDRPPFATELPPR